MSTQSNDSSFSSSSSTCSMDIDRQPSTPTVDIQVVPPSPTMDDLIDGFQVVQWLGSETRISDEDGREEAATALWHRPAMPSTLTLATDLLSIETDYYAMEPKALQQNSMKREGATIWGPDGSLTQFQPQPPIRPTSLRLPRSTTTSTATTTTAPVRRKPAPIIFKCENCHGDAIEADSGLYPAPNRRRTGTSTGSSNDERSVIRVLPRKPVPRYREIKCTRCVVTRVTLIQDE
ncbi:hypothetical protein FRB91_002289 [Serendipita sp. 411]|nr:hypothetical protein FRB91_002289 [Serendipita sp. 411]